MGREGGSDTKVFNTKEEVESWLKKDEENNTRDYSSYAGDNTDSGRGDACYDGGGFYSYCVIWHNSSKPFENHEDAKKVLGETARKRDPRNDSIVWVVAPFYDKNENTQLAIEKLETESKQKIRKLYDESGVGKYDSFCTHYLKVDVDAAKQHKKPVPVESYPPAKELNVPFYQCFKCKSTINGNCKARSGLPYAFDCPVCHEVWGFCGEEFNARLQSVKTAFNEETQSLKKRKRECEMDAKERPVKWLAVSSWTSAHF